MASRETWGIVAGVASSLVGGSISVTTRWLAVDLDPAVIGVLRFGIGAAAVGAYAAARGERMPPLQALPRVCLLGVFFFGGFTWLFNASYAHTTAARGALALATLPLLVVAIAALMGVERLTLRKAAGVLVAIGGVAGALSGGLWSQAGSGTPAGAWRGDLLMLGAALTMALYNIWSRPLLRSASPMAVTALGMACGTAALALWATASGGWQQAAEVVALRGYASDPAAWLGVAYLGLGGGAVIYLLWTHAIATASPTRVAVTITVNPIAASLLGLLWLAEPVGPEIVAGLVAVTAGILLASGGQAGADRPAESRHAGSAAP